MTIDMMGALLPGWRKRGRLIAVEPQAHGRMADVDQLLTYEQMADDTAELTVTSSLAQPMSFAAAPAPALGCSSRSSPGPRAQSRRASGATRDGMHAAALEMFPTITPELLAGSPMAEACLELARNPGDVPARREACAAQDSTEYALPEDDIRAIAAPTMIVFGDSDVVRLDHAVELFGLLDGGVCAPSPACRRPSSPCSPQPPTSSRRAAASSTAPTCSSR